MLNDEDDGMTEEEIFARNSARDEEKNLPPKLFVNVNRATNKSDSFVDSSRVPPLKLLARARCSKGTLEKVPISVKEGLEFYHALVFPNNCPEEYFFSYLKCRGWPLAWSSGTKMFEKLCKEPLKIALYFERKIRTYRDLKGANSVKTRRWVAKYNTYLQLPFHDIFLALSETKYRVIEYCKVTLLSKLNTFKVFSILFFRTVEWKFKSFVSRAPTLNAKVAFRQL